MLYIMHQVINLNSWLLLFPLLNKTDSRDNLTEDIVKGIIIQKKTS